MRTRTTVAMALLATFVLTACGGSVPKVDSALGISGAVGNPVAIQFADLAEMPQTELNDILMEKSLGEDTVGDWSGVPLADLLEEAGVGDYVSITAIAGDGYAIEISKDELQDAIIALKEDGEWIATADPDHGPIRLVCPYTPANRWVYQLIELQVNAQSAGVPDNAALKITGAVETEVGWTEEKLRSMDAIEAQSTNGEGETNTHTGIRVTDLLSKAGPTDDASMVVFVADDGYSAEVPLADVEGCADCIVAFQDQGGFRIVAPGFPGNVQVKGVVEMQVN